MPRELHLAGICCLRVGGRAGLSQGVCPLFCSLPAAESSPSPPRGHPCRAGGLCSSIMPWLDNGLRCLGTRSPNRPHPRPWVLRGSSVTGLLNTRASFCRPGGSPGWLLVAGAGIQEDDSPWEGLLGASVSRCQCHAHSRRKRVFFRRRRRISRVVRLLCGGSAGRALVPVPVAAWMLSPGLSPSPRLYWPV